MIFTSPVRITVWFADKVSVFHNKNGILTKKNQKKIRASRTQFLMNACLKLIALRSSVGVQLCLKTTNLLIQ